MPSWYSVPADGILQPSAAGWWLGTADLQSLADLGNSFEVVRGMRWVPFTIQTAVQLAVATLRPVLPLTLTM